MNDTTTTPQARRAAEAIRKYVAFNTGMHLSRDQSAALAALIDQHTRLPEVLAALDKIDRLRDCTQFKPHELDLVPDDYIDDDGFAEMPYGMIQGLRHAANIARDARALLAAEAGDKP